MVNNYTKFRAKIFQFMKNIYMSEENNFTPYSIYDK